MIINVGSINIDLVYRVPTLPEPGETLTAISNEKFLGGKGINQSVAIARAGGVVKHVGAVGEDGAWALSKIEALGVETTHIARLDGATGHAIINVDERGENAIVIAGAANQRLTIDHVESVISQADPGTDWVLLQNETNLAPEIVDLAKKYGLKVAYAAAPFVPEITVSLLDKIDLLAVNEGEANALAYNLEKPVEEISVPFLLITKGGSGAALHTKTNTYDQKAFDVVPIDTTGAGDTFLGSFLAEFSDHSDAQRALEYAAVASAIQVTRNGAAPAIPLRSEVMDFMDKN